MKDRRRRKSPPFTWTTFFWCTLLVVFSSTLFTSFTILRRYHRSKPPPHHSVRPNIPKFLSSKLLHSPVSPPSIRVRETVVNPNQAVILLNYPPSCRHFYTEDDFLCVYLSGSGESYPTRPIRVEQTHDHEQIVRCPLHPRRLNNNVSLSFNPNSKTNKTPLSFPSSNSINYKWHPLAYEALFDRDNTTLVFVKAFNLKPARESDPTRFQCLYGFYFTTPNYLLTSRAVSVAQEIVRCETPSAILASNPTVKSTLKVSVRIIGAKIIPSVAMPGLRPKLHPPKRKLHFLCVCTMLRNQARFLKEWVMYHSKIGVQRWFIYDNNSDDDIAAVIRSLRAQGHYNITRHVWPWIKSQEAGFAHCALRARQECEWVGFIDVDEFFNLKIQEWNLQDVIRNETVRSTGDEKQKIGEIRTGCFSFGPSGQKKIPKEGVMMGYTCRMGARERHKSIVRPEVLRKNLINVVHHFYLEDDYVAVDVDRSVMVINHYKYQVWKVFKDKFQRRVAAYVADWKKDENVGSKDRVPGLGTAAVEPPDWANRFCEVWDLELKNRVERDFMDPNTHALPWQSRQDIIEANNARRRRRRRRRPRSPPSSSA